MTTILIIISTLAIALFGKFIYDSYITNNTKDQWDRYKKLNPEKATVVENSSPFNMNTSANLRFDGYYKTEYEVSDFSGNPGKVPCIFIFNKHDLVAIYRHDEAYQLLQSDPSDVKNLLMEMNSTSTVEITPETSTYNIKGGKISMIFYDGEQYPSNKLDDIYTYIAWRGTVIHNGLILSAFKKDYDYEEKSYDEKLIFRDLTFSFQPIR